MNVTILEDRPWAVRKMVDEISKIEGVSERTLVFYCDSDKKKNDATEVMRKYQFDGVECYWVDDVEFESTMNKLFEDDKRLFFFDLALNDKAEYFEERINVKYAQKRFREGDKRIWFYTTSDTFDINKINKQFERHNIPVLDYLIHEKQLVFDINRVREIIEMYISFTN
mgnify:CR=1 FL=1